MTAPWKVRCEDCGFDKVFHDQGGIDAEQRAKSAKAGHIGGGSVHYSNDGPCQNVTAEPANWGSREST